MLRSCVIVLLFFFVHCSSVPATKYYVSSSGGNDSWDGKTEATPWKNISKVNSGSFRAGDTIAFKRGDSWREMLKVPVSGNADAYIVFTSYGPVTDPKPRILGSTQAANWTDQGGNIWRSSTSVSNPSTYSNVFFVTGAAATAEWGVRKNSTTALFSEFDWTYSSNNIYVYSIANPGTKYISVEAPQRMFAIDLNDKNYIEVNGIDLFYCTWGGVLQHTDNASFTGFTMRNCESAYHGDINGYGYGVYLCYNTTLIEDCVFHDCGRRGVSINNYSNYDISDVIIQRCTFYNGYHTTGPDIESGTSTSGDLKNITVRYCLIYDQPDRDVGWGINSVFVQGPHGGSGEIHDFYFYCNIVKYPHGNALSLERVYGSYIYNNTFYGNNPNWTPSYLVYADTYCTGIKLRNNLFYTLLSNETQGNGACLVIYGMDSDEVDSDYNLFYRINSNLRIMLINGTSYYMNSISSIRSRLGWETHSPVPADPGFVSISDFHLKDGSPAIAKGINILINGKVLEKDFGNEFFNNPPSIGAYEGNKGYIPPDPPPVDPPVNPPVDPPVNPPVERSPQITVLYPNPSHNDLTILREGSEIPAQTFRIIDMAGKIVFSGFLEEFMESKHFPLNLNAGTFLLQVFSGGVILDVQKLIIVK